MKGNFNYFIGKWNVERSVGREGTATGVAKFTLEEPNLIRYREDLQIKYFNSLTPQTAYKEYTYTYDNGEIFKNFTDKNLFYKMEFNPDKTEARGSHLCNKDSYNATYEFLSEDSFIVNYKVLGPAKDYTIETTFTKIKESESLNDENLRVMGDIV